MLQLVEPPKIPRLAGGKQFFESTESIPGVEEGVVRLVGLSKKSMDSRRQAILQEDEKAQSGG
ncbi:hypothetical protein A2U01_0108793 [Trifolium medium]|uniref:Uncharacterized protein n=1 Tax=Trifolium medium TaxID=97028 RepID=A0A392VJG6_9FABA|nr:hypothetical protein [Trifolium medium]